MVASIEKPEDVVDLVGSGESSFFLTGDDELTMGSTISSLRGLIPESTRMLNIEQFSGGDLDELRLRQSLGSVPMMAPYRLLEIREPENLPSTSVKLLQEYLDNPRPETILVIVAGKKDKLPASVGRMRKKMAVISFDRPAPWKMQEWVEGFLAGYQLKIDRRAAGDLIDAVGYELRDLANELEKLALLHDPGETITREEVSRIVGEGRFAEVQKLRKSLLAGDRAAVFRLVGELHYQGEQPIKLINLLSRLFADLWRVKSVKKEARDHKAAASMLGLWPSVVRDYWDAAERIDRGALARAQEICCNADYRMKTGRGNPRVLLQQTVLQLSGLIGSGRNEVVGKETGLPA